MKKENTLLIIKRLNSSPYWSDQFLALEKNIFTDLNCTYLPPTSDGNFDVAITNTHSELNKLSDEELTHLKLIIHPNSGYDNYSPEILKKISAPVILGNELRAHAVAETILAEIFSKFSLAPHQNLWQEDRKWPRALLKEQTILIIGHGMIGSIVKNVLQAIGATVNVFDPYCDPYSNNDQIPTTKNNLIILAASLNPSSFEIVNAALLETLSPKGMLINCARGELIHIPSLLNFLRNNPDASAYLDVFPHEPANFQELTLNNLKTSSHIAGVHHSLEEKTLSFTKKIIFDFLNLDRPDFLIKYQRINLHNRKFQNFLI